MFVHLLVLACACALTMAIIPPPPPYQETLRSVEGAWKILEKNILSMDGNVPLLNDSRRDFAEIYYVISFEGIAQSGCLRLPYSEDYPKNLNKSAPEAIYKPQTVIADVKRLIQTFNEKTKQLQELIRKCQCNVEGCDLIIQAAIQNNPILYNPQMKLLSLASVVASVLDARIETFNEIAERHSAHEFVTEGMDNLKEITLALSDLYRELYRWPIC